MSFPVACIECKIQFEDVNARLTQESPLPVLGVFENQALNFVYRNLALRSDAANLELGGCRRDIGIESRSRCSHQIDGDGVPGFSACSLATSPLTRAINCALVGPRLEPLEALAS